MIRELEAEGITGEDLVKAIAHGLDVSEERARFLIAYEHGETTGDLEELPGGPS